MPFTKYDYHSHTDYSRHSDFTVDSLVRTAIKAGLIELGISEHVFSEYKKRPYALANYHEFLLFKADVETAKAKYQDQIHLLLGLEVEIIDPASGKTPFALNKEMSKEVDYLIFAMHYYDDGHHFRDVPWTKARADFIINTYRELVANSAVHYIAHPDAYMAGARTFDADARRVAETIATLAAKHGIILGFNINGLASGLPYPSLEFWKVVAAHKVKVKIELDAHRHLQFEPQHYAKALRLAAELKLDLIEKINWKI